MTEEDLTAAVLGARRGLRRDVATLIDRLPRGLLYAPLSASIPGAAPGGVGRAGGKTPVSCQILFDPAARRFGAFFTRPEFLGTFGKTAGWKTDGRALRYVGLAGSEALALFGSRLADGSLCGLVINPGRAEELALNAEEAALIARGEPIPLEDYVGNLPVQPGEKIVTSRPATPPPTEWIRAIAAFVGADKRLAGYEILEAFSPERHRKPRLLLSLRTAVPEVDEAALIRDLQATLKTALPQGQFIDVVVANAGLG